MEPKKLYRSSRNKMIAGVCAGLADYLGIDATVARVLYAIASICTAFAGLLVYIILIFIIPSDEFKLNY